MLAALALLTCIGAGIVGGVFFAFSTFVMQALAELPARQGILAMQKINVVVLNRLFLGVFLGTTLLAAGCAVVPFFPWTTARSPLLLAAGLLYVLGTFCATMVFNVPRNDRLARLDAASNDAANHWPVYVREWSMWNHLRTAAAITSAACSGASLAF